MSKKRQRRTIKPDESLYEKRGTVARNGSRSRADRPRPDDGSPARGASFVGEEMPRGVRSRGRQRLRQPDAVQRPERPEELSPHRGSRPGAARENRGRLCPDAFGRRHLSAEGHPCVRSGYDGQNDGGSPPPGHFNGVARSSAGCSTSSGPNGPTSERRISSRSP